MICDILGSALLGGLFFHSSTRDEKSIEDLDEESALTPVPVLKPHRRDINENGLDDAHVETPGHYQPDGASPSDQWETAWAFDNNMNPGQENFNSNGWNADTEESNASQNWGWSYGEDKRSQ